MLWRKVGKIEVGENKIFLKTIKIKDEIGQFRRMRVCTVWGNFQKFTKIPVIGQLCKDDKGLIGILITGKDGGFVKIGKNFLVSQSLIIPLNSIGKTYLKRLVKKYNIETFEIDDNLYGIER